MQCTTQFHSVARALKWSGQPRKNNLPLHAVQQALCFERFLLWIFCDSTQGNAISKYRMRFSTPKDFQHTVEQWIMYVHIWSRIFVGKKKRQFWEVNLLKYTVAHKNNVYAVYFSIKSIHWVAREGMWVVLGRNELQKKTAPSIVKATL